jgi:hypothetical protein
VYAPADSDTTVTADVRSNATLPSYERIIRPVRGHDRNVKTSDRFKGSRASDPDTRTYATTVSHAGRQLN